MSFFLSAAIRQRVGVAMVLVGAAVLAALVVPSVSARGQAVPVNTAAPTVVYPPGIGNILTPTHGTWSGAPTSFTYQWLRCPSSGGGADASGCSATSAPDPTGSGVLMEKEDLGETWRTRVTATNASGSATAVSSATPPVSDLSLNVTGCPDVHGAGTVHVNEFSSPARLVINRAQMTPSVITRNTQRITLRIEVIACDDRNVIGALVYATPTPFNQFTGAERPTDATGWATLTLTRQRGFPASSQQQLLVVFVRATKPGEDPLAGISSRRLMSFPVRL
jgi:hypothetical protein